MKNIFPEFYDLEENEIEDLWKECYFVFDANVLLNLYRYSFETRNNLIEVLKNFSDRIWISHQFALEYQRNRMGVMEEQKLKYSKSVSNILSELENAEILLKSNLKELPFDTAKIKDDLKKSLEIYPDCNSDDKIREQIDSLFKDKVGDPFEKEKLASIYQQEGIERYRKEIPPGYADAKEKDKDDPTLTRKFGDLIGWLQIIEKAKKESKSIIFITSERKEDWWRKVKGKTVGPRHELLSEFQRESGQLFYMYDMERFLSYAKESHTITDETIDEVKKVEEVNNDPLIGYRGVVGFDSDMLRLSEHGGEFDSLWRGVESSDILSVEKEIPLDAMLDNTDTDTSTDEDIIKF